MKDGIPVALVGRPNAGKSSLLNALVGYDRAIVTDIPGTTRDTIEEKIRMGPLTLRLIDTAGLKEKTDDRVEQLGVDRSREALRRADLALIVIDGTRTPDAEDESLPGKPVPRSGSWFYEKRSHRSAADGGALGNPGRFRQLPYGGWP